MWFDSAIRKCVIYSYNVNFSISLTYHKLSMGRIGAGGLTINIRQRNASNLSCMKGRLPCTILMEGGVYFSRLSKSQ